MSQLRHFFFLLRFRMVDSKRSMHSIIQLAQFMCFATCYGLGTKWITYWKIMFYYHSFWFLDQIIHPDVVWMVWTWWIDTTNRDFYKSNLYNKSKNCFDFRSNNSIIWMVWTQRTAAAIEIFISVKIVYGRTSCHHRLTELASYLITPGKVQSPDWTQ